MECSPSDHSLPVPRYQAPRPQMQLRHNMTDAEAEAFCVATAARWAAAGVTLPETVAVFLSPARMAGATSYRAHVVSEWGVIAAAWAAKEASQAAGQAACAAIVKKAAEHGWPEGAHDGRRSGYHWDLGTPAPQYLPGEDEAAAAVIVAAMVAEIEVQQQLLMVVQGKRADLF